MRIGYVVSRSSNKAFALREDCVVEVCFGGPDPESDAKSYAKDYVKSADENAYVYRVTVESVTGYKVSKEVVSFAIPL